MADLILKPVWKWVSKAWRSMDDLAEKIDDLICIFDGSGDTTMDTIVMYLFIWMLFGLVVLGVGKFFYAKYLARSRVGKDKSLVVVETPVVAKSESNSVEAVKGGAVSGGGDASAPIVVGNAGGGAGSGGGRYVPPTPPMRKRLGSKSGRGPGPGPLRPRSAAPGHPPPVATGPDPEAVAWVNDVFAWLYSEPEVVGQLLLVWVQSLNEFTKQTVAEAGVGVEFIRVLPESAPPAISNVFCECAPNDDVTITCDCETSPSMQLKVFRQKGEKVEVSHYRLNVNRFRARLHIMAVTEKLIAQINCDGWPEIKVSLAQVGAIKNNLDESQLQDVISDIVTAALRNTDLSISLAQHASCPRLARHCENPGPILPVHYDSLITSQSRDGQSAATRRLLVKVIKAVGLGSDQGCLEPYCVVEVDEPPQKNQTSFKKETDNPVWDEHFLFDLNNRTTEILLEVYDRCYGSETKFLGLGIVSMDELLISPSQRQVISLQAAPLHEKDVKCVSGTLTVEFLLVEGHELPATGDKPFKLKETLRSVSPNPAAMAATRPSTLRPDGLTNGGEEVNDSTIRELEKNRGSSLARKSTLIIHSVQRTPQPEILKVEQNQSGQWQEVTPKPEQQGTQDAVPGQGAPQPMDNGNTTPDAAPESNERSRSRRRKRDFFGTLRRRFNRSKGRSRSVGPGEDELAADPAVRSISADRARDPSAHSNQSIGSYLSVPGLREDSARSSLSEVSAISGASSKTYVNEASTLVLETIENGIKKYYLVPLSIAQRSRWKKKGTKLHIYNDHTFIAKHLPGGTMCQVCKKNLARRLGKQGYECRDCQFRCHKHCHVLVETTCPHSNIHSLELIPAAQSPLFAGKLKTS